MKEESIIALSVLVANLVWFGFWFYFIIEMGHSIWWIVFPVVFSWRAKEFVNEPPKSPLV